MNATQNMDWYSDLRAIQYIGGVLFVERMNQNISPLNGIITVCPLVLCPYFEIILGLKSMNIGKPKNKKKELVELRISTYGNFIHNDLGPTYETKFGRIRKNHSSSKKSGVNMHKHDPALEEWGEWSPWLRCANKDASYRIRTCLACLHNEYVTRQYQELYSETTSNPVWCKHG